MNLNGFDPWSSQWKRKSRARETRTFYEPDQLDAEGNTVSIEFTASELDDLAMGQALDLSHDWARLFLTGGLMVGQPAVQLAIPGEKRTARLSRDFLYDAAIVQTTLDLPDGFDTGSSVLYWVGFIENFPVIWRQLVDWVATIGKGQSEENPDPN
jgi:hypothetical protein